MTTSTPVPGCPGCEALQARIIALEAQVTELRERLDQNSQNSSKPPSSDPPWKARPPRSGSGGKRGGKPGHPGRQRAEVAPEDLAGSFDYFPSACRGCGAALAEEPGAEDPSPQRHQVWELPIAPPEVTEHRRHGRRCPCCAQLTWAELPPDVSPTGQGPRLEALVVLLTGAYRMSRESAARLCGEVWGIPLCKGTVSRIEGRLTRTLGSVYTALGRALAAAVQINVDETPWWEAGKRSWLWTATTQEIAYYRIDAHRNREAFDHLLAAARDVLGPEGLTCVLGSDRYSTYLHWPAARHQHCLAHVQRDLVAATQAGPAAANAAWAQEKLAAVFSAWHRFCRGELDREGLRRTVAPFQTSFRTALKLGEQFGNAKQRGLFRKLLAGWERLWVFLEQEGVEPTNNRAERALRGGVIWRKTSFGSQSERGRQYVECMLSVVGTARRQDRPVLSYLTEVARACHAGRVAPDLLHSATP